MANYRFTFEMTTNSSVRAPELRNIYAETEKYIRTVLVPKGSKLESQSGAEITNGIDELTYEIHEHDGDNNCSYCRALAQDGRS